MDEIGARRSTEELSDGRGQVIYRVLGVFFFLLTVLTALLPHNLIKRIAFAIIAASCLITLLVFLLDKAGKRYFDSGLYFIWNTIFCLALITYFSSNDVWRRRLSRLAISALVLMTLATTVWQLLLPSVIEAYSGVSLKWDEKQRLAHITEVDAIPSFENSPAEREGLQRGDVIKEINGIKVAQDFKKARREWQGSRKIGRQVSCLVERDGKTLEKKTEIVYAHLPISAILVLMSRSIAIFIFLLLGGFVFWRTPQDTTARLFLMLNIAFISILKIVDLPPGSPYTTSGTWFKVIDFPFSVITIASIASLGCFFLHFFLIFPSKKSALDKYGELSYLLYLPCILLIIDFTLQIYLRGSSALFRGNVVIPLSKSSVVILALYLLSGTVSIAHSYLSAQQRRVKRQVRFVFLSIVVSLAIAVAGGIWAVNMIGKGEMIDVDWTFGTFYAALGMIPIAFAYAIIRHRAMNINLLIRGSLIYSIVSIFVAGLWLLIYYGVIQFALSITANKELIAFFLTIGVAFVIPRLEGGVRTLIDRTFFRVRYDYQLTLNEFSRALTSIIDLKPLIELGVEQVCEAMHIRAGCLLLREEDGNSLKAVSLYKEDMEPQQITKLEGLSQISWFRFEVDESLATLLVSKGSPMRIEDIERQYESGSLSDDEMQKLIRFDAEFCVPIISKESLVGILILGSKLSEEGYSREDSRLLSTLASQAAIAIENTRLYVAKAEQDRIKGELENARRIQRAILPEGAPQVEGLDIASFFKPATEVGGDYYDYVQLSEKEFGIAVGDVSGHGLDAGLMVSMAKSCLYTTTKMVKVIEDVMQMMNDMVCDVRDQLLMTFSFSVIDMEKDTLFIANAGHPFPYHLTTSGELRTIEAGAYPLGVRKNVEYPVHSVTLGKGDILVYYSDGIVETENRTSEQLGFEQFEFIIKNSQGDSAQEMCGRIMEQVNNFCEGVAFVDDVTLIVVKYVRGVSI